MSTKKYNIIIYKGVNMSALIRSLYHFIKHPSQHTAKNLLHDGAEEYTSNKYSSLVKNKVEQSAASLAQAIGIKKPKTSFELAPEVQDSIKKISSGDISVAAKNHSYGQLPNTSGFLMDPQNLSKNKP
jgi:hypothetical protein